jgi:hypothetical protein
MLCLLFTNSTCSYKCAFSLVFLCAKKWVKKREQTAACQLTRKPRGSNFKFIIEKLWIENGNASLGVRSSSVLRGVTSVRMRHGPRPLFPSPSPRAHPPLNFGDKCQKFPPVVRHKVYTILKRTVLVTVLSATCRLFYLPSGFHSHKTLILVWYGVGTSSPQ